LHLVAKQTTKLIHKLRKSRYKPFFWKIQEKQDGFLFDDIRKAQRNISETKPNTSISSIETFVIDASVSTPSSSSASLALGESSKNYGNLSEKAKREKPDFL